MTLLMEAAVKDATARSADKMATAPELQSTVITPQSPPASEAPMAAGPAAPSSAELPDTARNRANRYILEFVHSELSNNFPSDIYDYAAEILQNQIVAEMQRKGFDRGISPDQARCRLTATILGLRTVGRSPLRHLDIIFGGVSHNGDVVASVRLSDGKGKIVYTQAYDSGVTGVTTSPYDTVGYKTLLIRAIAELVSNITRDEVFDASLTRAINSTVP